MDSKWARPADPTPREIAIETAIIRGTWTEETYRLRAGTGNRRQWHPPRGRISLDRRELYDITR